MPRGLIATDKNNFQPRVGIAWDVTGNGRTAVRAGVGVFHTLPGSRMTTFARLSPPFEVGLNVVPYSFSDPYHGTEEPFPYNPVNPRFAYPIQMFSLSPDFRDGYTSHFNFNIERQLSEQLFMEVGYFGTVGHKLTSLREANTATYTPTATPADVQSRRPFFPQYYASIATVFSGGNSNYHSLQVKLDKRLSRGLTFGVAYTFSKSIDQISENRESGVGGNGPQDPNNYLGGERGLSAFDQRHILAINGVWDMPFWKNKGLVSHILGGWRLGGLTRITSGLPFSVNSGLDQVLGGSGFWTGDQRMDVVGNTTLDPGRPHGELVARYFDTSGFGLPEIGRYGNSGRNILIGPGFADTDLSIIKSFPLPREKGQFEFRGEIFNLFNNVNFYNPDALFVSPAFGRLLTARDARIAQLALRFTF
ncbi:MAG: hypothetical protein HY508_14495 [Acidobacteria bacterium]|nr:hypothetical protein [Acidobacteriota bacterium]